MPRRVRVPVQDHVHVFWRAFRRNVDELKTHAVPFQVNCQRPIEIAVAIAADDGDGRPKCLDCLKNGRRANVAEMPDLIRVGRERLDVRRQFIVSVGENEDFHI